MPNYEFNLSRLLDQDGDTFPSYLDPLDLSQTRAYAYFASYGTNSYDPNDDNGNGHSGGVVTRRIRGRREHRRERGFTVNFPTSADPRSQCGLAGPQPL